MRAISENIVGVPKRIMTKNYGLKRGREKSICPIVIYYGEKVLTKNVNLSTVEYSLDCCV
jgi:hypothetical protein